MVGVEVVMSEEASKVVQSPALPEFMTVEEAAELLRVNRSTMYEMVKTAPWAKQVGRQIRISRTALMEWFRQEHPAQKRRRSL
jgi:excisionase family DNA binding protein